MSLSERKPTSDVENIEHDDRGYKKCLMFATTTSGTVLSVLLTDTGRLG